MQLQLIPKIFIIAAMGINTFWQIMAPKELYEVQNTKTTLEEEIKHTEKIRRPASEVLKTNLLASTEANPFIPILDEKAPEHILGKSDQYFASQLDQRSIRLTAYTDQSKEINPAELDHCKATVEKTLATLPDDFTNKLKELTLYLNEHTPRGAAGSKKIELSCSGSSEEELTSVLVHELGHIVDLSYLVGSSSSGASQYRDGSKTIWLNDPSIDFYSLSWRDSKTQRYDVDRNDFISGYAMNDAFEDFAESFNFYVLHGEDFRALAKESKILRSKYDFIYNKVFNGTEFESERVTKDKKRVWDSTLLPYDRAEFLSRAELIADNL